MTERTCEYCFYFVPKVAVEPPDIHYPQDGTCHVNPPTVVFDRVGADYVFRGEWPGCNETDWCGRHQAKTPGTGYVVDEGG